METALAQAESWLVAQQEPNGSFGTDIWAPRDSAIAVLALVDGSADTATAQAAVYLDRVLEENTPDRSLRALALARTGRDVGLLLDSLLQFRNGGGMGGFGEHQSTLIDTALAVEAFSLQEETRLLDIASLLDYLQLHHGVDGGWSAVAQEDSSKVYVTAEVLYALLGLDRLAVTASVRDAAIAFLLVSQHPDSSFGDVAETAIVYRALVAAGVNPAEFPFASPVPALLSAQLSDGSWNSDVFDTAHVLLALRGQRPNLALTLDAPDSVTPGVPIRVIVTVRNTGPAPAPASQLEIRFDNTDGELAASAPVEALAPGAEVDIQLDLDATGRQGEVELFALADATAEISETDEDDNAASATVTLRVGPDLALFSEDLALAPTVLAPDQPFDLLISARNLGETALDAFTYRVTRLVGGVPAEVLAEATNGPIEAGGARLLPQALTLPAGEHTLEVTLDPGGLLDEENEANNTATLTFFVVDQDQPDLAISAANFILTPAEPVPSEMVDVSITVENLGNRDATTALVLFENGTAGLELRRFTLTVLAGSSETVNDTVPLSLGAFALAAVADPDGAVLETDESNNRAVRVFRDLPDLAIGFDNLEVLTTSPLAGDPVEVRLTVRNAGTASAANIEIEVTADGSPVTSELVPEIAAGGNHSFTFTWTATAGQNTLLAIADAPDLVLETSEGNNQAEREVAVPRTTGPDLEITAVDRGALVESAADLGVSGSVDVTVTNSGDADVTAPFELRLFEDRDGDGRFDPSETVLGSAVIDGPLAAGAAFIVTVAVDSTVAFHHPLAWAEADAGDVIPEIREDNNRATLFAECETVPVPANGVAAPIEEWFLSGAEIESAPIVVQLSDDNGDGHVDSRDTPDVVFHTADAMGSAIKAVSGLDGSEVWTFRSTPSNPVLDHLGQVAAADIDGDGVAEVIGQQFDRRLIALEHTSELKWVSDPVEGVGNRGLGGIAIGDLDGDGVPEIVHGRSVVSADGVLLALGTANRGQNFNFYGPLGTVVPPGVASYPQSLIADIDLDGTNELVAGNAVYRLAGNTLEVVWHARVADRLMEDGFSAVGNLDADPEAEIVYVSSNQIIVYNHDGTTFAGRTQMTALLPFLMPTFWGGPPTIADLDGVGAPEILVVTATELIAYRSNLTTLWRRSLSEDFGGFHGVTAFDLDGDGVREVFFFADTLGSDAQTLYILDGATGATLHTVPMLSKTAMEYTTVADVDGDGRAELVVPSNVGFNGDASTQGLHVLGHPSWQGTRPIWNQYGYHVTNVLLDGTVPSPQVAPWQADNLFRGNRELPAPPLVLANLTVSFPRVGSATTEGVPVTVRIGNGGRAAVGAGTTVELFSGDPMASAPVGNATTSRALGPGQWEDVEVLWIVAGAGGVPASAVVDFGDAVTECDESDNQVDFVLTETILPDLSIAPAGVSVPSPALGGQIVDVGITVANVGNAQAEDFVVRLWDGEPGLGTMVVETVVGPLAPGAEVIAVVPFDTLGTAGVRLLHAVADANAVIAELSEDNNRGLAVAELVAPTRPDPALESFVLSPPQVESGQPVVLVAQVTNRGAAFNAGFAIAFSVDGVEVGRLHSPGLFEPGAQRQLEFELATAPLSSFVTVEARIDPDAVLAEENEANNAASTELEVQGSSLAAAVTTDQLSYPVDADVAIAVEVQSFSTTAREVILEVSVVDALGATVAAVAAETRVLEPGINAFAYAWNTASNLPGGYAAVVRLLAAGTPAAQDASLFSIARDAGARASIFADRDVYTPLQAAILRGSVGNTGQNDILSDLTATIAVLDANGNEVARFVQLLPVLFPGADSPVNAVWEIDGAAPGTYTVTLSLRNSFGVLRAFAAIQLAVEDSATTGAGLSGDLTVSPVTVGAGAPLLADFTATNGGNADMPDLSLRFDVMALVDGSVISSVLVPQPLARAEAVASSLALATDALPEGDYLVSMVGVLATEKVRLDRAPFTAGRGVSISDAEILEGDAGSSVVELAVTLSSPSTSEVTVDFATADATATAPADYDDANGQLVFAPGETEQIVTLTVHGDVEAEADEVFLVTLANPVDAVPSGGSTGGSTVLGDSQGLVTLIDEEGCASPNLLENGDAEMGSAETGSAFGAPSPPNPLSQGERGSLSVVGWTGSDGWHRRFADPPPLTGTASFGFSGADDPAELFQDADVSAFAARIDAGTQTFQVDGFVRTVAPATARLVVEYRDATGTIVLEAFDSGALSTADTWQGVADQRVAPAGTRVVRVRLIAERQGSSTTSAFFDRFALRSLGTPTLSLGDAEVLEGNAGTTVASPRLELACALVADLTVDVATVDGTAEAGFDYLAVAEPWIVPAGEIRLGIAVDVLGDLLDESDEVFEVTAMPADSTLVVLRSRAAVSVLDDDGAVLLAIDSVSVNEGNSANAPAEAVFTVSLSAPSGKQVRVDYATADGSARAGDDYTATTGTLTIPPGNTAGIIAVPITGDLLDEDDESFAVRLTGSVNAELVSANGQATILDDDVVEIRAGDATALEGDDGSSVLVFPVSLSVPSVRPVSVAFATADGDAVAGTDYLTAAGVLDFAPGETTLGVDVPLVSDLVREPLETLVLVLSAPAGGILADPEAIGTILDDDGILISIADVTVTEPNPGDGLVEAVVPVRLSKAAIAEVRVDFTTLDGTAIAGADYQTTTGTLVFPIGSTLAEVRVALVGDAQEERVESFFVELSNPLEGLIEDGDAEVVLIDDDGWFLNGHATDTLVPGCIVVTPDLANQRGSAWRSTQLDLSASFDKTFRVFMGGRDLQGGEGGNFVLQQAGTTALGGFPTGFTSIPTSVGIELDTNSFFLNQPTDHLAIGLNGTSLAAHGQARAGVDSINIEDGQEHLLRVTWNTTTQDLDVHFDGKERIFHHRDIVSEAFGGNPRVYWGFTGLTGGLFNLQYFCDTALCFDAASDEALISVGDARVVEGDPAGTGGGSAFLHFPVILSCPVDHVVEVDFSTRDDTAVAGDDYAAVAERLVFQPGETSRTVSVEVFGDLDIEADELLFIDLGQAVGGEIRYQGVGTIRSDDIGITIGDVEVLEGDDFNYDAVVEVELTEAALDPFTVDWVMLSGTATTGSDVQRVNGRLNFADGERVKPIRLTLFGDTADEGDEHFFVDLRNPTGGSVLLDERSVVTIRDDDKCPSDNLLVNGGANEDLVDGEIPGWTEVVGNQWTSFTAGPFEGAAHFFPGAEPLAELVQDVDVSSFAQPIDAGLQVYEFLGMVRSLNQTPADTARIVVEYRDASNTTVLGVFDSGETAHREPWWRQVHDVRAAPFGTRFIRVRLIAKRAPIGDSEGDRRLRVGNNDGYFDGLLLRALDFTTAAVNDVSIVEGEIASRPAVFTVALKCPAIQPVTVDYLTSDGTAEAGSDYEATLGTLTFQPGEQVKTVAVPVFGDSVAESAETFFLNLTSSFNGGISDGQGVAVIEADEVSVAIADTTVVEGDPEDTASQAIFAVELSAPSQLEVRVDYATVDGAAGLPVATAGSDYEAATGTVVFAPGETHRTIAVTITGELLVETDEAMSVVLSNPVRAGLAVAQAHATIFDDDLSIRIGDAAVVEGDTGSVDVLFEVTLSKPGSLPVSVHYTTEGVTATAGEDFVATSGTLTIPSGETLGRISITVLGDMLAEASEGFEVHLSNAVNGGILRGVGFGSITDDDDAPGDNLIKNPGAEKPTSLGEMPDWSEVLGTSWTRGTSDPTPLEGAACFAPGPAPAELIQDVDVAPYASFIDRGVQRFLFEGFVRSVVTTQSPDSGRFVIEYRDVSGQVLESFDSGEIVNIAAWEQIVDLRLAPVGTRVIRVRLLAVQSSLTLDSVCFDRLALRSLGTPVLRIADGRVLEGNPVDGGGTVEMVIPVTLSGPSDDTVSFHYTTADASAIAPDDYLPTSGSVVIPSGETTAEIRVTVVPDHLLELEEAFHLEISEVFAPEAVFSDFGVRGFIRDDENVGGSTRETRTLWVDDLRIFAWDEQTEITLIDIESGELLEPEDSRLGATNFDTNPFVLENPGDSFEGLGTNLRVRIAARDARGNGQLKPITVWAGALDASSRHPANPPSEDDPWMSYIPAFSLLGRDDGRELGRRFLGFTSREMYVFARRSAEPTRIVVEDLPTNTDADSDDNHVLGPADAIYADAELEIYQLSGFEDDTVRVTTNTDASVLVGKGALVNTDWTVTPPSYGAGDDGIELGSLFYTLVHKSVTVFPIEDDTTVTVTDLSDGDDTTTFTLQNGDLGGPYDIFTPVLDTRDAGAILGRTSPFTVNLLTNGDGFDNDFVKIESDKPILVYVGPVGSDVSEFADVAFSVPTGPQSRVTYCYAQNGDQLDLQLFGFDDDTEVTITSLTTTQDFRNNTFHDFVIGPGVGPGDRWDRGTVDSDVWWGTGVWGGELLRIASSKPVMVFSGDYDAAHYGSFIPFVVDTDDLPPRADAGLDRTVFTAEVVAFDGTGSFDQDAIPGLLAPRYAWDFDLATDSDGDGDPANDVDATEATPSRVYIEPGVFEVRLTFFDDEGESDTDFAAVTVMAHPLALTKTADRAELRPGETVTYTLTLSNGGSDHTGVVVRDPFPAHLSVAGDVSTSVGTVTGTNPIEVSIDTLTADATVAISFVAVLDPTVDFSVVTEVSNQASAEANGLPPMPSDDPATAAPFDPTVLPVLEPLGEPELAATKVDTLHTDNDGDGIPSPGDVLRYTITLVNAGEAAATGVVLRDLVPPTTAIVTGSVTSSAGTLLGEDPVEVDLGEVAAGTTVTVTFDVTVDAVFPASVDDVSNQGTVTSVELPAVLTDDPDVGGDADPTVTMIVASPLLLAEKTAVLALDADADGHASPGDTLAYSVILRNLGNTAAGNVVFLDPIPAHTVLVPGTATTTAGTVVESAVDVQLTLAELAVGDEVVVSFRVTVDDPIDAGISEIVNQGAVAANGVADVLTDDPSVGGAADPTVTPITASPVLVVEKTDSLYTDFDSDGEVSPGDELLYRVTVSNTGNTAATGVALSDAVPTGTALVPGTVQTDLGVVVSEDPVEVALAQVDAGTTATVTFRVLIDEPFAATEVSNQASVTSNELGAVLSDDPDTDAPADATVTSVVQAPDVSVGDTSVVEGDSGTSAAVFTLNLSHASGRDVTVSYRTVPGTASSTDYQDTMGDVVFAAGETEQSVSVEVVGDLIDENDETFVLELTSAAGGVLVVTEATGTIVDNDDPPAVSVAPAIATEGVDTAALVTVALSAPSSFDITVAFATADGTAQVGADYSAVSTVLSFPAETTSRTVSVPLLNDQIDEPDETLTVELSRPVGALLGTAVATVTIVDDDEPPVLVVEKTDALFIDHGNDGDVSPGDELLYRVTVNNTSNTAATGAGLTDTVPAGTVLVPGTVQTDLGTVVSEDPVEVQLGQVDAGTTVTVTFRVTIDDPFAATEVSNQANVTSNELGAILSEDPDTDAPADATVTAVVQAPDVSVGGTSVLEGDSGTSAAVFTLSLSRASDLDVTVSYRTVPGTASADDYQDTTGDVVFAPGETEQTVGVAVFGDLVDEDDETFILELTAVIGGVLAVSTAEATIIDDELCPGPNLLVNPSAERREPGSDVAGGRPTGWTLRLGDFRRRGAAPEPVDGRLSFFAGQSEFSELFQDVDVSTYAATIAGGDQAFAFGGFVRTFDENPPDVVRIVVEYRDATNAVVLDAYDSGEIMSPFEWTELTDVRVVPAGTGWIRVRLLATRFTGLDNDGFVDALSLRSLGVPAVWIDDVTLYESSSGTHDAVFTVRLSCPYEHDVTLPYTSADVTALADEDYLAVADALFFPSGTSSLTVTVPVIGDTVHELHETFVVHLGAPVSAGSVVLADQKGLGTILNDDFCPRSPGFWKNHMEDWPVDYLRIGGREIEAEEMLELLNFSGPDAASKLGRQLVVAKLNLGVGSDPFILPVVEEADAFLAVFPPGSDPRGADRKLGNGLQDQLDDYNNLDCQEQPVDPEDPGGDDDDGLTLGPEAR